MKFNTALACIAITVFAAKSFAAGDYELSVMEEEVCHEVGQKAVNAFGAKKKNISKAKVLERYKKELEDGGLDNALRRAIDYGYDKATSVNEAGMHGWAICKDAVAQFRETESAKYR
jgi:hypothetical protein